MKKINDNSKIESFGCVFELKVTGNLALDIFLFQKKQP